MATKIVQEQIKHDQVEVTWGGAGEALEYANSRYIDYVSGDHRRLAVGDDGVLKSGNHYARFLPGTFIVHDYVSRAKEGTKVLDWGGCVGALSFKLAALGNVSQAISYDPNPYFQPSSVTPIASEDSPEISTLEYPHLESALACMPSTIASKIHMISDIGKMGKKGLPRKVDCITSLGVLGNMQNREKAVGENLGKINSFLKKGGTLLTSHEIAERQGNKPHHPLTLNQYEAVLNRNGFEITFVTPLGQNLGAEYDDTWHKETETVGSPFPWAVVKAQKVRGL